MNNSTPNIPEIVQSAFPPLLEAVFVERLSSPIPIAPDTLFDIFKNTDGTLLCLVSTDYPDPQHQSNELNSISNQYHFSTLLKPYSNDSTRIEIREHDDMDGDFLVKEKNIYYYVAALKKTS